MFILTKTSLTVQEVKEMKSGLVLEGGGTRGIYTAGILDVFLEYGIEFDGVIGVSAGAILQEFVLKLSKVSTDEFLAKMQENGILAGIKLDDARILVATGDMLSDNDIEKYAQCAKGLA